MAGMSMAHQSWYANTASYLGIWIVMMVPMMLPSLSPTLWRYRRSLHGAGWIRGLGLTAVVGLGYFTVWTGIGAAVAGADTGLRVAELQWAAVARWRPVAAAIALLAAGCLQLTGWKARRLALYRAGLLCGSLPSADATGAWRYGLALGIRCSVCCGALMLTMLTAGMMNLSVAAAVTLAISAERLAPAQLRVARTAGVAIVVAGVIAIARI